jgi:BASS family bile acid:Na+ symporter
VTLTTLASILAVPLTPGLVGLLAGEELGITASDFWRQLWTIAWTVATPLLLGLALRWVAPRGRVLYESVSPAIAVAAIVAICCSVIQAQHDRLGEVTIAIVAGVIGINALGFGLGGLLGGLYQLGRPQRITLTIEIGMQNAGMGVVIATTTFHGRGLVAIPAVLFTIWCIVTASALIAVLKRRAAGDPRPSG